MSLFLRNATLISSDFKQNWNFSTNFVTTPLLKILQKARRWFLVFYCFQTDEQTERPTVICALHRCYCNYKWGWFPRSLRDW